jgi:hypothetical protein
MPLEHEEYDYFTEVLDKWFRNSVLVLNILTFVTLNAKYYNFISIFI